jgi:hypothetical protein
MAPMGGRLSLNRSEPSGFLFSIPET